MRTKPMPRIQVYANKSHRPEIRLSRRAVSQRDTGFPPAARRAIRARAGMGDPDQARCECHGIWLGRHGGELQHRVARSMGGRGAAAPPWINNPANGLLMCPAGHREAEARTERSLAAGWRLRQDEDPRQVPVVLWNTRMAWLTSDGTYSAKPPDGEAA